ncbi:MAG TPA: hypothetical protein VNT03_19755 [Baekduia sp.]|nr:hypothetical protein [Baekduia sp.]
MSSRARIAIVAAAAAALVVAFVIARGGSDADTSSDAASAPPATQQAPAGGTGTQATPAGATTPAAPAIPVVRVVDAKPQGGIKKLQFTKGDTIRFRVTSDTADEIHFHGYDVAKDVKAGGSVTFSVKGTIEGRFVVELEDHETQIAEVEVDPS